ncbi:MAG: peptidoglycan DD-metalloendopeptidase family protein [Ignavibacteriaceae bacterium]
MQIKERTSFFLLFFYSIVILLFITIIAKSFLESDSADKITKTVQENEPEVNQFGFSDLELIETIKSVERNETLSDILNSYNLGNYSPEQVISKAREAFNVRSLRTGRPYHTYVSNDSLSHLRYLVYQPDNINFIVFDLNDTLRIYEEMKPVEFRKKFLSADIKNSLFGSLSENGASIELAIKLSQIFAWQVDFYAIQKGDNFKIIYEEKRVDDKIIGTGEILGAYFQHRGTDYYAIPFEQDGIQQFFDQNGNSLRKTFLKAPLEFSRISSRYSKNRFHPVLKRNKPHLGTDYAAPHGTPIRTIGDGIVLEAGYSGGNGNYIKVKHNSTYTTQYLHMSRFAKGVKRGSTVKQGQVIGYVGSTGLATGPHLCFRFWKNGKQVDPYKEINPPSYPVKKELLIAFDSIKTQVITELDKIGFKEELAASL